MAARKTLSIVSLSIAMAGCQGGLHHKGEHRLQVTGSYGEPIGGNAVWPEGDGTGQNAGVTVEYDYFTADRLALVGAATPYRIYNQDDGDVFAYEIQFGLRYHFLDFEMGEVPVGLFGEALGGVTHGAKTIPETGSHFNFTQDTGIGVEARLTEDVSWIAGYRLKHLSNARMFDDDNPSQNDNFVYTGLSVRLGG